MPSGYPPEKNRAYMREYMRRYRERGALQRDRWTEARLTETWAERKRRMALKGGVGDRCQPAP